MSIETVQTNANLGVYTTIGTMIGGCIGVGTAYLTKPYLKNNIPNDSFEREIKSNIEKITNNKIEQLKKIKNNEEAIKIIGENTLEKYVGEVKNAITKGNIADTIMQGESVLKAEQRNLNIKELYKNFIENTDKVSTEYKSAINEAKKSMNTKFAFLFCGIGAVIAGIGTYLLAKNG